MTTTTDAELDALVAKATDGLCTRSALSRSDAGVIDLTATVALFSGLADAITALRAELAAERAKVEGDAAILLDAYKAILVLHRMLDKSGLSAGVDAANDIADRIVASHPEFPGLCALRAIPATKGATK